MTFGRQAANRQSRQRHEDLATVVENRSPITPGGLRFLGTVVDGGMMGTGPDKVYLVNPTMLNLPSGECEGCTSTPVADTTLQIPVNFLGNTPAVGDMYPVFAAGGKWVAERGKGKPACDWFCSSLGQPPPDAINVTMPIYGTFTLPRSGLTSGASPNCASDSGSCIYCLQTTLPYPGGSGCSGGDVQVCFTIGIDFFGQPGFFINLGDGVGAPVIVSCTPVDPSCDFLMLTQQCPPIGGPPASCSPGGEIPLVCNGPRPWTYSTTVTEVSSDVGAGIFSNTLYMLFGGPCPPDETTSDISCAGQIVLPFTFSEA